MSQDAYYKQVVSKWTGSICGKVADASGKSLKEVSLELIPVREGPFKGEGDETTSDANGSFCFNHVDPGKFLLKASGTGKRGVKLKGFYPSGIQRSDSTELEVNANQKLNGLIFRLQVQPTHALRFRIVNAIDHPMPDNLQVMVVDSLNPATMEYHEEDTIEPDGTVTFQSVPEGHYFATVFLDPGEDSQEATKRFQWKPVREEIDVNGEMQEVVLTLVPLD